MKRLVALAALLVLLPVAPARATTETWVSPEGMKIEVNTASTWTAAKVYDLIKASARDLGRIGPTLTVKVQDTTPTSTATSYGSGVFRATMYLKAVNSTWALKPDAQTAHEYGHAWSLFHLYVDHGGNWASYLRARWTTSDGSVTLATDPRLDSTYAWNRKEIIADDYRLLFGSPVAISSLPKHLNTAIPQPANVTGLRSFLVDWSANG